MLYVFDNTAPGAVVLWPPVPIMLYVFDNTAPGAVVLWPPVPSMLCLLCLPWCQLFRVSC
jgi:hypothetical protein